MERTDCLICDGQTDGAAATIAQFLSHYCGFNQDKAEIRYCRACDFAFFKRRLTDAEAAKPYSNYRGEEYNRERIKIESWFPRYKDLFEDKLSPD